jgi:DNA-binding response OmpR family regulator
MSNLPKPDQTDSSEASAASTRRALIAETDPISLRLCRGALAQAGFEVETAETGLATVVSARDRQPHIILVASELRDGTGFQAIEWLRANDALHSVPIVLLGNDDDKEPARAVARPAARLRKPLSASALRRLLRELLPLS